MSIFIKICGLTTLEAVARSVALEVDAVGFVFADSPRQVTVETAEKLARHIPSSVARVAVFRRPALSDVQHVVERFDPDFIQADHTHIPSDLETKALPVFRQGVDPDVTSGRYLYEGPVSGVGESVDWTEAARVGIHGEMILAGGLNPANIARAIEQVRPFGVDVSSGVESRVGVKDPTLIEQFVDAARIAAGKLVHS